MQLASQRPHPPPVPPRPSRQVVAEALKRSPRPPCPTRQAPPPPNTKPWRSDQNQARQKQQTQQQQKQQQVQQQLVGPTSGRTIVYESKECGKDGKEENAPDDNRSQQDRKQDATVEKSGVEENRSENEGKIPALHHEICAEKLYPTGNVPANIVRKHNNNLTEDRRPQRRLDIRKNTCGVQTVLPDPRGRCKDSSGKDQEKTGTTVSEKVEVTTATTKPQVAARTVNVSFEDERRESLSSPDSVSGGRVTVSHVEKCKCGQERDANGPTPACRVCLGEQQQEAASLASAAKAAAGNLDAVVSSIKGSVPCADRVAATVLVVDEAERKITPSDHEDGNNNDNDSDSNIHQQDWLEEGVRYSSTQITLHGDDIVGGGDADKDRVNGYYDHHEEERITDLDFISIQERIAMSSLQGLPPLPRSLSGFNLSGGRGENGEPPPPPTRSSSKSQRGGKTSSLQSSSSRPSPPARQLTTLDTQLAVLRREMFGLRQLDLSLLSQLWSLNESIQEFRQLLQEQEDRAPSPSPSSEEGDDTSYGTHPPPPPRRPAPTLHHHRPPRPPRPPRPSASDESPSSEEYGAV
ncbi:uncharacterized protein LOC109855442 isoform X1 [Pseudomyrmex gracilis]|uniref:uncharacterized protein LOC109855442 isoform X1 n=2 Tax=Pseudomyrmex gracilis TaxID=219809 RepID=UPI000994BB4D|nr:uncharacterized protein LOC109855442 isoform X1 [Pseudomyrmex gracilis]